MNYKSEEITSEHFDEL